MAAAKQELQEWRTTEWYLKKPPAAESAELVMDFVIIHGAHRTGKSMLAESFVTQKRIENDKRAYQTTVGERLGGTRTLEFTQLEVEDTNVTMTIVDMHGNFVETDLQILSNPEADIWPIASKYVYPPAAGVMLVYDVTERVSLWGLDTIYKAMIKRQVGRTYKRNLWPKDIPIVIVGNKMDKVDDENSCLEEGKLLAQGYGLPHFETSTESRQNVDEAFTHLAKVHALKHGKPKPPPKPEADELDDFVWK